MKSRIYKLLLVLMAIAMVIDWPVQADAVNGRAIGKAVGKAAEHSGFFSRCSRQTEQSVNKATQQVEKSVAPRAGVAAGKAIQNANASARNNNGQTYNQQSQPAKQYQMARCSNCAGRGVELWDDMSQNTCPVCNGRGRVMVEY